MVGQSDANACVVRFSHALTGCTGHYALGPRVLKHRIAIIAALSYPTTTRGTAAVLAGVLDGAALETVGDDWFSAGRWLDL